MNLSERRAAVRAALIADPRQSNCAISREVRCSTRMVAKARAELAAAGEIEAGPVWGARGKLYMVDRGVPVTNLCFTVRRIRNLIDWLRSPEFAVSWGRAGDGAKCELARETQRLYQVLLNRKASVRRIAQ
jgi:hypothetical protein